MTIQAAGSIEEFFDQLTTHSHSLLSGVEGTIRFDLQEDGNVGHWLLRIDHGRVTVSRRNGRADAVVAADRALFARLVAGKANALTAGLRGQLRLEGETRLVVAFDRLMPSPPGGHTTIPPTGRGARKAADTARATGTATRTAKASAAVAAMTRRDRPR